MRKLTCLLALAQRDNSMLTFETDQIQGGAAIVAKLVVRFSDMLREGGERAADPAPGFRDSLSLPFSTKSRPWMLSLLPTRRRP